MIEGSYDLGGRRLQIVASDREFLEELDVSLGHLRLDGALRVPPGEPPIRLALEYGTPLAPPNDARLIAEGNDDFVGAFAIVETGPQRLISTPSFSFLWNDTEAAGHMVFGAVTPVQRANALMLAIERVLQASGQVLLHAAGLLPPVGSGRPEGLILLHAPSGVGKTTSSLALIGAGFRLASDDGMVVRIGPTATAWGLPRALKVHRNTAALMPWIPLGDDVVWDSADEAPLPTARLGAAALAPIEPAPVTASFHLTRDPNAVPQRASTWAPLSPQEAAITWLTDNVRQGVDGLPALEQARFERICALVARIRTFRIALGSEPASLAGAVLAALASPARDS